MSSTSLITRKQTVFMWLSVVLVILLLIGPLRWGVDWVDRNFTQYPDYRGTCESRGGTYTEYNGTRLDSSCTFD